MSAPTTFAELRDWLQKTIITLNHTPAHAVPIHAETVAMNTAKAVKRALEILAEKLDAKSEDDFEDKPE